MASWASNGSTPGSYGHMLMSMAEGLRVAVENDWMNNEEAKAEFRSHVLLLQKRRDARMKAASLRTQAEELEGEEEFPI